MAPEAQQADDGILGAWLTSSLQERRRVEEQYVMGLKRLSQFRVPNAQSELGYDQPSTIHGL